MPFLQLFRPILVMENHPSTSNATSHCYFSNNFVLDEPHEEQEEKPSITLPIFDDSSSTPHVPSVDNLVMYNQPHKNPKRKRSRFLKISTSPTRSSSYDAAVGVSKPKITKKPPDPSAPKITRPCTECGKKFWSWKALFGHMRCHPERQWRGINPPPNFRHNDNVDDSPNPSPRKNPKSLDHLIMTDEDREIAESLLQLANGLSKPDDIVNNDKPPDDENVVKDMRKIVVASDQEPCTSSGGGGGGVKDSGRFECSGCKKVFGSHQALGGHRASHKNVKGCYASGSISGSGLTQAVTTNLDLNFPPPDTLISGEDQYDSSSSYSSTYSATGLDLRLRL
ncbi:zinc finger protein ZAT3-like [Capsicum annuum]|nr:zinc finger protein ZAT3-like [Capsicum annuum]